MAQSLAVKGPRVRQEDMGAPGWKRRWDEARRLAVDGDLAQAADRYRGLLAEKEIVEARWEMVTILLALGLWGEAIDDIESLSEGAPDHPGYLQALAAANLSLGRFRAGAEAFRRLLAVQPENDDALAGLVYSLLAGEERREAAASLSDLVSRDPQRRDLREALATLAYDIKDYATAWPHLAELCKAPDSSPVLVRMAAKVSYALQSPGQAAEYWQRYAVLRPDDLEARQWLADYFTRSGKIQQALPHLEAIRQGHSGDLPVLKRVGLGYLGIQDYAKAAAALEEYLSRHAEDQEAARALVAARLPLGNPAETLRALERYFAVEPQPDSASLAAAARLYDATNAHGQAVVIYRRLLAIHPGDPALPAAIVKHLEAVGRDDEALAVWRQQAGRNPSSPEAWRRMAVLLERLGRTQELYETLAKLHELDPADNALSLRLLTHYADNGDVSRGLAVCADVERLDGPWPEQFYYLRAEFRMQLREYDAALRDLERFLAVSPLDEAARRLAITAAGRSGDTAQVLVHHQALGSGVLNRSASLRLLLAQAYVDCGAETEARDLLRKVAGGEGGGVSAEDKQRAYAGLAASFTREHRLYEAEESLRIGLAASGDRSFFLPLLVDAALSQRQVADAGEWLAALRPIMVDAPRRLALLEAKVLAAQGEWRKARNIVGRIDADLPDGSGRAEGDVSDRLQIASFWVKADKPRMAVSQCRQALATDPDNLEARVILEKIEPERGQAAGAIDLAGLRFDQLCDLAEVYSRHDMPGGMAKAAGQALIKRSDSLRAGLLMADAFAAQGRIDAALSQLELTSAANPDDFSLKARFAAIQFMRGNTAQIEALADSEEGQSRPDILLLHARALWRKNLWQEALQVYRNFLTPRVADSLRAASREYGVHLPDGMRRRTVWEVVARDPGPDRDLEFASQAMAPAIMFSFLDHGAEDLALAAARLVATYRWQEQFAMEYAPRQAVVRKEYTIAKKQYQALLHRYPGERMLLFDLAGMDSVLGNLGEEAAAYNSLQASGVEFPELGEALTRNQLKQRPRAAVMSGYQREAGRNGYVDSEKDWQGLSFWNSFKPLHDGEVTVERINYHGGNSRNMVRATRATGSYSAGLLGGLTVRGGAGVQGQERADSQAFVANAAVIGKVGDGMTGTLSYGRDVVDDTTASLERNIFYQDLLGGIVLEPLPRLAVGGGYLARDYSDNNWTTGYDLWASYLIFSEPTFLQLKYSYDFKESREGALAGGIPEADGFPVNDHPYWAPKNYWLNQVGLVFKHSLVEEPLGREAPRYYVIEYAIGHDVDGYVTQTAKAELFAECNANFLVEAGTELATSQSFRRQEYRVGISYRW